MPNDLTHDTLVEGIFTIHAPDIGKRCHFAEEVGKIATILVYVPAIDAIEIIDKTTPVASNGRPGEDNKGHAGSHDKKSGVIITGETEKGPEDDSIGPVLPHFACINGKG